MPLVLKKPLKWRWKTVRFLKFHVKNNQKFVKSPQKIPILSYDFFVHTFLNRALCWIIFRLVLLDKLRLQTRAKEEEQSLARGGKDPFVVVKNPSASKGGVAETSIKVSKVE